MEGQDAGRLKVFDGRPRSTGAKCSGEGGRCGNEGRSDPAWDGPGWQLTWPYRRRNSRSGHQGPKRLVGARSLSAGREGRSEARRTHRRILAAAAATARRGGHGGGQGPPGSRRDAGRGAINGPTRQTGPLAAGRPPRHWSEISRVDGLAPPKLVARGLNRTRSTQMCGNRPARDGAVNAGQMRDSGPFTIRPISPRCRMRGQRSAY